MDETPKDQKTEEPTPHRLQKALEDGQIAFSSELTTGFALLFGILFFMFVGRWFFNGIKHNIRERLTQFEPMREDSTSILAALRNDIFALGGSTMAFVLVVMVSGIIVSVLQTRFNISFKPMELKWSKLNPISGLKRTFSIRSPIKGLVSIAKAAAVCVAVWYLTEPKLTILANSPFWTLETVVTFCAQLVLNIGLVTAILMVVIGAADYAFQYWKQMQDLRMSRQDLKDEHKNVEGDPMVKARIRRLQNERSQRKNLQEVPNATVLVTNPTHFAVALRYEPDEHPAPVVIAKGEDLVALKMIEIAKQHGVAVVERKPLARFMYANLEVGQSIPPELFHAVAEILNFIRTAEGRAA